MNASDSLSSVAEAGGTRWARWPGVVGVLGMVIGAMMALSEAQEIVRILTWTEQDWQALLGPAWTESVVATLPSMPWQVASSVFELGLGCLLFVGAWWMFWRERRAIRACRSWAWLAIAYAAVIIVWVATWMPRYLQTVPGVEQVSAGELYFGMMVAVAMLLTFPVFLLYWLARHDVRADYEVW